MSKTWLRREKLEITWEGLSKSLSSNIGTEDWSGLDDQAQETAVVKDSVNSSPSECVVVCLCYFFTA